MTDLSRVLREKLHACADVRLPPIVHREVSTDGTRKWLVKVDAGNSVEMVFIPDGQRGTLCVSSQVGCALNCSFCATAKQGFNRNLTSAEVIGQLWLAVGELTEQCQVEQPVTNVVMMGMGEPLLNIDGVFPAMRLMVNDNAFGLARRRVTLSTAGVVPGIYKLKKQIPVSLAVSLHAPNDTLRNELVPINRSFSHSRVTRRLQELCERRTAGKNYLRVRYVGRHQRFPRRRAGPRDIAARNSLEGQPNSV